MTIRSQGRRLVASLHCWFDDSLPIVQVHQTSTRIETALHEGLPSLERVLVHAEPREAPRTPGDRPRAPPLAPAVLSGPPHPRREHLQER